MYQVTSAVIANGASLSGVVNLQRYTLVGLVVPAAWTAADLTFAAAPPSDRSDTDPTPYNPVCLATGTEYSIVNGASVSKYYALDPDVFAGIAFLKVRSGTSAAAVNQGAARTVTLVLKDT